MDGSAFCTAAAFKIKELHHYLSGRYRTHLFRDIVHIEGQEKGKKANVDVFYFPYGSVVCWGIDQQAARPFLKEVKEFQLQPLDRIEEDTFSYSFSDEIKVIEDTIFLPDRTIATKVAISHALAQSVKLGSFEDTISKSFEKTKQIPENLAKRGKIYLSTRQIRKKMGELFIDRSSINQHVDVLDTPEFFWEHPDLEPYYSHIANELDIETRGQVLNQRLDVLRELFEMLSNEVYNQHSIRLEWIITILIFIEVVLTLLTHYQII